MRVGNALADVAVVQVAAPDAPRLEVTVMADTPMVSELARAETTTLLCHMLGLDIDLTDFYRCAERDPDLRKLATRFRGVKPPRFPSLFESLANAIACQQLTTPLDYDAVGRITRRWAPYSGLVYFHFLLAGIEESGWLSADS